MADDQQRQLADQLSDFLSESHPGRQSPRMLLAIYGDGSSLALDANLNALNPSLLNADTPNGISLIGGRRRGRRSGGDSYDI